MSSEKSGRNLKAAALEMSGGALWLVGKLLFIGGTTATGVALQGQSLEQAIGGQEVDIRALGNVNITYRVDAQYLFRNRTVLQGAANPVVNAKYPVEIPKGFADQALEYMHILGPTMMSLGAMMKVVGVLITMKGKRLRTADIVGKESKATKGEVVGAVAESLAGTAVEGMGIIATGAVASNVAVMFLPKVASSLADPISGGVSEFAKADFTVMRLNIPVFAYLKIAYSGILKVDADIAAKLARESLTTNWGSVAGLGIGAVASGIVASRAESYLHRESAKNIKHTVENKNYLPLVALNRDDDSGHAEREQKKKRCSQMCVIL